MYYRLMSKFMHYRLADQLCAVDGHTYRVNAVSHRVYLYLVLANITIIFTMLKYHCLRVPNLHMNLHPWNLLHIMQHLYI